MATTKQTVAPRRRQPTRRLIEAMAQENAFKRGECFFQLFCLLQRCPYRRRVQIEVIAGPAKTSRPVRGRGEPVHRRLAQLRLRKVLDCLIDNCPPQVRVGDLGLDSLFHCFPSIP